VSAQSFLICPDCDALQRRVSGARVTCFRCGAVLVAVAGHGRRERATAFTLAAIPLFVAANALPLLRMEGEAGAVRATVLGTVATLGAQRLPALALLVLLTAMIVPAVQLGSAAYLLFGGRRGRPPRGATWMFQLRAATGPWAQLDILLGGLLVVFGKLASVFPIVPDVGLLCMTAGLLLEQASRAALEPRHFWEISP
jgi:paraquat-inducible protein A